MKSEGAKYNITILSKHAISLGATTAQVALPVNDLVEVEAKIIIFAGYSAEFKTIFERAKVAGLTGKGFAWLCSDGVSKNDLIITQDYVGVLIFFPAERGTSTVADDFERLVYFYWNGYGNINYPLIEYLSTLAPGETRLTVKPFTYFAATCIDNLIYGLDRFLKSNSSRTVDKLLNGSFS